MDYEWLRQRDRADLALPSGIGVTLSLVRVQEAILEGSIPVGVLREIQEITAAQNGDPPTNVEEIAQVPQEVIAAGQKFRRAMIRRTLKRVAPSVAELSGPDDDAMPDWVLDKFDQEDYDALAAYALRETPLPASTSP